MSPQRLMKATNIDALCRESPPKGIDDVEIQMITAASGYCFS
jgi:hypothetical protein